MICKISPCVLHGKKTKPHRFENEAFFFNGETKILMESFANVYNHICQTHIVLLGGIACVTKLAGLCITKQQKIIRTLFFFFCVCRCHIRVIDTFGTEPAYNNEEYATVNGYRTNWGYWNLNCKQYMTMFRKSMTAYYWLELHHDTIIL